MSTAATQQPPAVPPRPSRGQDGPKIPPRPMHRRIERSVSPSNDRFAPSPLNESPFTSKSARSSHLSLNNGSMLSPQGPIERSASVDMPSVGEEGNEYAAVAEELSSSREPSTSPEHTRTVGEDIKLHAPKPSLPAVSAKQRVAAVTRTDSDRAASFGIGIGRPSIDDVAPSNRSLKKKASTTSQLSTSESHNDDEQGIPEIGQQVPMYPNAGDVQAPSPAPFLVLTESTGKKNHNRRTSGRGFSDLPPGSYGLHGHGILSKDKLEADYYHKHPEIARKEHHHYHEDRANDFSMSSEQLNKIVRDTPTRGLQDIPGTPREEIGWQAIEESASRLNSPRPESTGPRSDNPVTSPLKKIFSPNVATSEAEKHKASDNGVIHVDEPGARRRSVMFSDEEGAGSDEGEEHGYHAPILASDEVAKHPPSYDNQPAMEPPPERHGSAFEMEEPRSRPTSRPASIYKETSFDARHTPLEDVEEYEPLFPEDEKEQKKIAKKLEDYKKRFPSSDIWEDAPSSVHYTAEVSTPDVSEGSHHQQRQQKPILEVPPRDGETPAQAFARRQEELAEKETLDPALRKGKPLGSWAKHQPHLAKEVANSRPGMAQRFPSQDVWEDTPDSLKLECEVGTPQQEDSPTQTKQPDIPQRPARKSTDPSSASGEKPSIPERPKPKQTPSDDGVSKPTVPDRPKPQVPARPAKTGAGTDKDAEAAGPRSKPAVPARPVGGKIAALQAGFMSDLNKRLQLGPQAPKKEETAPTEDLTEEKEKAPLSDARKGRARGPQRRAPRSSASPSPATVAKEAPSEKAPSTLSFSTAITVWSVDPDEGHLNCNDNDKQPEEPPAPAPTEEKTETLATNMAGETILEATTAGGDNDQKVEPVEVEEVAKD